MTMGKVDLKIRCIFFFIIISVQRGFSEEFGAHQGAKDILLQRVRRQSKAAKSVLKVTDYHVRCSVVSRYAHTTIQSSVWNQLPVTKEAAFEVDLPSAAFISNFTITSNDKVYIAQVKERSVARKMYDAAKKQGKTAGLVATKEREIEKFRVAVSVPSGTRMSFSLSYEELLPRRLGRYELTLGLRPGGLVTNLTLDVSIAERTGLSFIKVLPLKTSRLLSNTVTGESEAPASTQVQQNPRCARVHYSPSLQQQSSASSKGLNADYIIQYDVELSDLIGDIQVFDGYFVHYFAPRGLPVVPKDVIFVIDVSGSMIGTKIKQTKQAMSTILGDLREEDHFNIITFSDKVHTWRKGRTVRATRINIRDAKDFVKRIIAEGWTNINAALLSAAQLVNPPSSSGGTRRVPLVIFLTDGEATIGVTSGDFILSNAKSTLGATSLFGLAFGDDADFPLLRRLALDNRGVARMVYEDADAALQLKGFYDEVASPLLSDIQLTYMDDQAFDVTRSLFPNYFQGSELVVTGKVKPGVRDLKVSLTASGSKQKVKVENEVLVSNGEGNRTVLSMGCPGGMDGIPSFVRRLWAYYTIKELLLAKLNTTDPNIQKLLGEKATNLSLKYNFVTPVTSLVVVKPDADEIPTSASTTTVRPTTTTENATMSAADANQPQVTTHLYSLKYVPSTPAPQGSNTDTDPDVDQIATFVSATFSPMPGVTDGPKLWEAAGLLDVSTSIQLQRKDMEVVKDYDATYDNDLDYDSWDESASNPLLQIDEIATVVLPGPPPPSILSSVRVFSSSVDGDPHFVVQLPKLKQNLCFTVDGRANDVLRLLEDSERGIMVDGHLMWAPSKQDVEDRSRTYFDQITISTRGGTGVLGAIMITLSLDAVVLEGEGQDTLHTNQKGSVTRQGVMVSMESRDDFHQSCWIELTKDIRFLVLFHHYRHPSYLQMAHLGFYITDGQGLSLSTKGLLGQFQHADMRVTLMKDPRDTLHQPSKEGVLRWGVIHMPITLQDKTLKDTVRKGHLGSCWVVPKAQVERLLGHPYQSYVVDHL
ncbi:inter-alpha-trypsin inhibitor heavy chain H6 isoform X6 [Oncorhynchus tshawytscha]|uniref:inter-alpha-trypsin inhibitor heavy chain H6 isoform X6 n=1 Tax=Oncorhynchus tshawytscha TaxID=74940 RepID=UPI000D0A3576|nr:inter-alpha-trypsin inhibitor heavy chain H6 isoform X6 [Oncorhynchus tshawytscha]